MQDRGVVVFQLLFAGVVLVAEVAVMDLIGNVVVPLSLSAFVAAFVDLFALCCELWRGIGSIGSVVGLGPPPKVLVLAVSASGGDSITLLWGELEVLDALDERTVGVEASPSERRQRPATMGGKTSIMCLGAPHGPENCVENGFEDEEQSADKRLISPTWDGAMNKDDAAGDNVAIFECISDVFRDSVVDRVVVKALAEANPTLCGGTDVGESVTAKFLNDVKVDAPGLAGKYFAVVHS